MKMGMLGMGSCVTSGAGGIYGCTMQGPCSHCSQMASSAELAVISPAGRPDIAAISPPLGTPGRSPAPNPAPPKPHAILS